jgi:glycosyltransferase involved in cell wall biosynthesis
VATRVGGLADLEGEGVVLVEPGDQVALRGAVERLLAHPETAGPRRTAVERYSLQTAARSLVGAYEASLRAT